ncbi:MAG: hypothetical protein ACI9J0_004600, partial [Cryomorphaceae bacterium]
MFGCWNFCDEFFWRRAGLGPRRRKAVIRSLYGSS